MPTANDIGSVLDLQAVRFTYRHAEQPALDAVSLVVGQGEFVVVVGPSGAGKSTLCYLTNGLIPHFIRGELAGEAAVWGHAVRGRKTAQFAPDVGLVFQDFEAQLFSTNVELEVAFGPENFALPREEIARRVADCLATVHLTGLEQREPATLSGGQKQRLAIASVLSLRPRLIVMDEPTTDLDPIGKAGVFAIARDLQRREEITLLLVEHETEEILQADRIVVMEQGRVIGEGTSDAVLRRVDWLEEKGVQPLGAAVVGHRLGLEPVPLTETDAAAAIAAAGYRLSVSKVEALAVADTARSAAYGEPVLESAGLEHTYPNGVRALQGADVSIRRGEFVAVVGQNGSGKTTLVKHFNGLLSATAGTLRVGGRDAARLGVQELGRQVGYVFQNPDHQIFAETVFDEVAFGPRNFGLTAEAVGERVAEALAAVDLTGKEQEDPFSLTKGERQRVAVASILAQRPEVIILDEPTTGLDYRQQRAMMELVRRLNEAGHTSIAGTHTMWVVAEYAHRTVVVHDGRIVMDGPTRQVMRREAELVAASLKPPQVVRLGNLLLGAAGLATAGALLSPAEVLDSLEKGV